MASAPAAVSVRVWQVMSGVLPAPERRRSVLPQRANVAYAPLRSAIRAVEFAPTARR